MCKTALPNGQIVTPGRKEKLHRTCGWNFHRHSSATTRVGTTNYGSVTDAQTECIENGGCQSIACTSNSNCFMMQESLLKADTAHDAYVLSCPEEIHEVAQTAHGCNVGVGNLQFLDRHPLTCPEDNTQVINRFQFRHCTGKSWETYRFDARCYKKAKGEIRHLQTPCHFGWNQHLGYLDRHPVECGEGEALMYAHMVPCGDNANMRWNYGCKQVGLVVKAFDEVQTACAIGYADGVQFLDRHNVDCGHDMAMKGFRMTISGCNSGMQKMIGLCGQFPKDIDPENPRLDTYDDNSVCNLARGSLWLAIPLKGRLTGAL